ncbi:hypothetical protein WG66_014918 [Moniliophthora roreri]|nr:hypothetical protein WG66_014918 [Moniliophthora roreri]
MTNDLHQIADSESESECGSPRHDSDESTGLMPSLKRAMVMAEATQVLEPLSGRGSTSNDTMSPVPGLHAFDSLHVEDLHRQGAKPVIVGNAHFEFIKRYRIYTDPTHGTYDLLGIRAPRDNSCRVHVWKNSGNKAQLGGEFALGSGLQCRFAQPDAFHPWSRTHREGAGNGWY